MNQSIAYEVQAVMPAAVATGLFVSLCTVQAPSGSYSASGQPDGSYADVAGLVGIQCMDSPESVGGIVASEQKTLAEILSRSLRHVLLDRFYEQLAPETNWGDVGWRAIVDGVTYDILGAENDSQDTQTRLKLQKATV